MKQNTYYISIKTTSLAHYIGKGLILPNRFYNNRPADVQTIEYDYIVLSKNKYLNDSNCAIEIILQKEEIKHLKETEYHNIFLYERPIPISRIKNIHFTDENQQKTTVYNIEKGETGFIPKKLIEINNEDKIDVNLKSFMPYKYNAELENKIDTFNRMLGGIAFVRYTIEGKYSENYFSILSYFNKLIEKEYRNSGEEIFEKYKGAFTNEGVWKKIYALLYDKIREDDVLMYAKEENINIKKSVVGFWEFEKINNNKTYTYMLAILNNYGEDSTKRKNTYDLLSDCKNGKIPKEKQEGIFLIYGINNGYDKFRSKYKEKIVKFKMDSLLDYYTIESVFQYAVNENKNNEYFEYIDEFIIKKEYIFNYEYKSFNILDETVITNKKTIVRKIKEWINEKFFLELEKYIKNLTEKIKELEKKLQEKNTEYFKLSKQIKDLEIENNNLKINIKELHKKEKEYLSHIEKAENEIKELQEKLRYTNLSLEELNFNLTQPDKQIKNLEDEKLQKKKLQVENSENRELKTKIQELEKKLQEKSQNNIETKNIERLLKKEKEKIINEYLELNHKNIKELRGIAKEKNITISSKMIKEEIIKKILFPENKENGLFS